MKATHESKPVYRSVHQTEGAEAFFKPRSNIKVTGGAMRANESEPPELGTKINHSNQIIQRQPHTATPPVPASTPTSSSTTAPAASPLASTAQFIAPAITRISPLDRLVSGLPLGFTEHTINGQIMDTTSKILDALSPAMSTGGGSSPGLDFSAGANGLITCSVRPSFQITGSANVIVPTAPGSNGWQAVIPMGTLRFNGGMMPANCSGKATINAIYRGQPTDAVFLKMIEDGEMDHVRELETLHKRHIVPYRQFLSSVTSTGSTNESCESSLYGQIENRLIQATYDYTLGNLAESKKYDDPSSTHHVGVSPVPSDDCSLVTMNAQQNNPQLPNRGPGNVQTISPSITSIVDTSKLTTDGSNVMEDGRLIRSFSSVGNANLALSVLQQYKITEIRTIGPFSLILSAGVPPAAAHPNVAINDEAINPSYYQVSLGSNIGAAVPNSNWVISEMSGSSFILIADFGTNRDQAYSSVDIMRQHGFTRQCWIGSQRDKPELMYFRV